MFKVNNDVVLVFLLNIEHINKYITLNIVTPFSRVCIVDFEQVNVSRE